MATVSAYTTPEVRDEVERIAGEEQRTQGQVAAAALELYTRLPAAARNALRQLSGAADREGAGEVVAAVMREITRAIVGAKWELATRRLVEEVRAAGALPPGPMSEEEIADLSVALVSGGAEAPAAGTVRRVRPRRRRARRTTKSSD